MRPHGLIWLLSRPMRFDRRVWRESGDEVLDSERHDLLRSKVRLDV